MDVGESGIGATRKSACFVPTADLHSLGVVGLRLAPPLLDALALGVISGPDILASQANRRPPLFTGAT
jgi:hypothetical protein